MTKTRMPISKFKAHCTHVLREIAAADKMIEITNHGKVVALLMPPAKKYRGRFWGSMRGTSVATDDLVAPAVPARKWNASK